MLKGMYVCARARVCVRARACVLVCARARARAIHSLHTSCETALSTSTTSLPASLNRISSIEAMSAPKLSVCRVDMCSNMVRTVLLAFSRAPSESVVSAQCAVRSQGGCSSSRSRNRPTCVECEHRRLRPQIKTTDDVWCVSRRFVRHHRAADQIQMAWG